MIIFLLLGISFDCRVRILWEFHHQFIAICSCDVNFCLPISQSQCCKIGCASWQINAIIFAFDFAVEQNLALACTKSLKFLQNIACICYFECIELTTKCTNSHIIFQRTPYVCIQLEAQGCEKFSKEFDTQRLASCAPRACCGRTRGSLDVTHAMCIRTRHKDK